MDGLIPPHDLAAETGVLGSCLIDREAVVAVAPILRADMFYLQRHADTWAAILAVYERREPPDLLTVAGELRRRDQLEGVGGLSWLAGLTEVVPTAVHVEYYARIVEAAAMGRALIRAGGQVTALGFDADRAIEDRLDQAGQLVYELAERRQTGRDYIPVSEAVAEAFVQVQALQDNNGQVTGLCTGLPDLDAITGGLQRSDLIILAARPSLGKTALALTLALGIAQAGGGVAVVSLEMSVSQLTQRFLALMTGIPMQHIRSGRMLASEVQALLAAMGELSELPIWIDDSPGQTAMDVRTRARRLQAAHPVELVIVDYLQLMRGPERDRVQEVSKISQGLKGLARELHVPVLALSQLSRAVEARENKIPRLSDLRDSGSLEQDADLVWFLYREDYYDKATERRGEAELHVAKHRNGPLGIVPLRFDASTARFRGLDHYQSPEGY